MKSRFVHAAAAALLAYGSMVSAATVTDQWKDATSGDWFSAGNWSTNSVPNNDANNTYLTLIAATGSPYTVTLSNTGGVSIGSLSLNSSSATLNMTAGTLATASGAVVAAGTFNLGGGTLSGATLTINTGATMNVTGWAYALNTIVNNGTVNIASGNELELKGGSVQNNGYLNISNNNSFPRTPTFSYSGFEPINNTGTVVFNSTSTGGVYSALNNNGGTLLVNSGTVFFGNNNLNFSGNSHVTGPGTFLYSANAYIAGNGGFSNTGTLTMTAGHSVLLGRVQNSGTINFAGLTDFQQGFLLGGGTYNVLNTASAIFGNSSLYQHSLSGTLNNAGTLTLAPGHYVDLNNGTFNNSGSFNLTGLGTLATSLEPYDTNSHNAVTNNGTITVTGTSKISVPLSNTGTVVINGGYLNLSAASLANGSIGGTGTLILNGPFTFSGGTLATSGTIANYDSFSVGASSSSRVLKSAFVNNGTVTMSDGGTLTMTNGGSIRNYAALNVVSSGSGTFEPFSGTIYNYGTASLTSNAGTIALYSSLINYGTLVVNSKTTVHEELTLLNHYLDGGVFDISAGANLYWNQGIYTLGSKAAVFLRGTGARFDALAGLQSNFGTISLQNGASFTATVIPQNFGTISVDPASQLLFSHGLINSGTILGDATLAGAATLNTSVSGALDGAISFFISSQQTPTVTRIRGGSLVLDTFSKLTVAAGGGTVGTSVVTSLTRDSSRLDLSDHDLIINYTGASPMALITGALTVGYANGVWNGPGLISSQAASSPQHTLGVAEASAVLGANGGVFSGQSVDGTAVLIKYTYVGDANLDGKVDILDLGLLASHWQQSGGWYQGDFNYDGKIDILDLGQLATDWQLGASGSAMSFADAIKQFDFNTAVPEPHLLGGTAIALLATRRRRAA